MTESPPIDRGFERRIGRLLIGATYLAVVLLGIGVVSMVVNGISPLDGGPPIDPGAITAGLTSMTPAGFLWLGLLVVIATPISRVVAAAVGFGRAGDARMALIAVAILLVIVSGVVIAVGGET
jgi:uncharacterized membrane protein